MQSVKRNTYRTLQVMAAALCCVSTWAFSESLPIQKVTLAGALIGVGWGDWAATALVSFSAGLVSLLQRFKRAEAGDRWLIFVLAHMGGSLISGVIVYLSTQAALDSPNRFIQALMILAAGWGGSTVADYAAAKINRTSIDKAPST